MAKTKFAEGEHFHIFNRGVEKRVIFGDENDRWRFLTNLFIFQSDQVFPQVGRIVPFVKHRMFDSDELKRVLDSRQVELVCFCLMPNHFHLVLKEVVNGGISKYMQRVLNSYTKYFNSKYKRTGHLFGGKFQAKHIDTNEYLNYVSAYIHLNIRELKRWRKNEIQYPWSSFQDFGVKNRWGEFLVSDIISSQFSNKEYQDFVESVPAKKSYSETVFIKNY